jgi:ABC-type transporter Mla subunit MlaD
MTTESEDRRSGRGAGAGADRAKSEVRNFAQQQKAAGADQIAGVAQAADATANKLQDMAPKGAEYVHDLAGKLDEMASALRDQSADELIEKAADFARKQPAVFFAGAVATGFALSRFLKSSADRGA